MIELTLHEFETKFDIELYEVYDNTLNEWVDYKTSKYTKRDGCGFPNPLSAQEEILLISMLDLSTKITTTFTSRPYTGEPIENSNIILCNDEHSLLKQFIDYWNKVAVDVISGWNIEGFDIPYIINRISNVLGDSCVKELSPWGMVNSRTSKGFNGKEEIFYDIAGVSAIDMLQLYKKFTYSTQESYSLDYISSVELGVGKLDHSEFATFKEFYDGDWNKFVAYNIIDCQRVSGLEGKMKLIELCLTMSYLAKINYTDVFSQIKMWDSIIYNHLKTQNIVIPKKTHSSKSELFEGAYVKEPVPGLYNWGVSFDAASLYPSIIQGWNISPETFMGMSNTPISVEGLLEKKYTTLSSNFCTAASGATYSKDKQGLLPELVDLYMEKRKTAKKLMIENESKLEALKLELKFRKLL